jgi:hypothetical protein
MLYNAQNSTYPHNAIIYHIIYIFIFNQYLLYTHPYLIPLEIHIYPIFSSTSRPNMKIFSNEILTHSVVN